MSELTITPQQWRMALEDLTLEATPDFFGDDGEWHRLEMKHVAAYTISLLARTALLEACVTTADALSRHTKKLLEGDKWDESGDYRMIHSDGMLDLEGLDREYNTSRAALEGKP